MPPLTSPTPVAAGFVRILTTESDSVDAVDRAKEIARVLFDEIGCGFLRHPSILLRKAFVRSMNLYFELHVKVERPDSVHQSWICKIFPRGLGQGSAAEVEAYRLLEVPCIRPFVIQRLASFECLARSLFAHVPARAREAVKEFGWEGRVTVLVLEQSPGTTMYQWLIRHLDDGVVQLSVVVAQAVFLLANMERLGVMHNDLHLNNIFVEKGPEPVHTVLRFGNNIIRLPKSRLIVRVFDFDLALVQGTPNTLLKRVYPRGWCREMGMCRHRTGRDLAQLLYNMHAVVDPGPQKQMLRLLVDNDEWMLSSSKSHVSPGHPCYKLRQGECMPVHGLSTPLMALRRLKRYFDETPLHTPHTRHTPSRTPQQLRQASAKRELTLWSRFSTP